MATIVKRTSTDGSFTYLVRVRRKGTPSQTATFTKLSDAKKWAHMTEGAVLEGRHFKGTESKRHTVGDMIDRYITDVLPRKRYSTSRDQVRQLLWWKSRLGHYSLADVTSAHIAESRDVLLRGARANATVVRYLAALSHAFTVAVHEWQWCEDNPVRAVKRPKEPRGRVRFLSEDERQRLLTSCKVSRNPYLYTVVVLALSTGARRGELLSLRWKDIDLNRGVITLHDTKNGERRSLHVTGIALTLLRDHGKVRRLDTHSVGPCRTTCGYPGFPVPRLTT